MPSAGLSGEFLLHSITLPMLVYMGSFSYMPSAGLRVEFLLHTPCWLLFLGVSLMSMLASLCRDFFLSSSHCALQSGIAHKFAPHELVIGLMPANPKVHLGIMYQRRWWEWIWGFVVMVCLSISLK